MVKIGDIIQDREFVKVLITYVNDPFFRGIIVNPNSPFYGEPSRLMNRNIFRDWSVIGNLKLAGLLYG